MSSPARSHIERFLEIPATPAVFAEWHRETGGAPAGSGGPSASSRARPEFEFFYRTILEGARVDPDLCLRALAHAVSASGRQGSRYERALFDRLRAHVLVAAGRAAEAVGHYESAAEGFRALRDRVEEGRTATGWAFALGLCGRPAEVTRIARRGRQLLPAADRLSRARLEANVGTAMQLCGRLDRAIEHYEAAERAFARAGRSNDAAVTRHNRALLHRLRGAHGPARRALQTARRAFADTGQDVLQLYSETVLLSLDLEDGRWRDGLPELERLRARFAELGDARARAWLHRELGVLFTALGAVAPALDETAEATALFDRLGLRLDAAHARTLEGRLLQEHGSRQEAFARLTAASEEWGRVQGRWARHRAQLEIARILLDDGDIDRAVPILRAAQRVFDRWDPRGDGALCRALGARAQLARGRFATSERWAREARQAATRYPARLERPAMTMLLAQISEARGDISAALRWSGRAIAELEAVLQRLGDRATRLLVGESRESLYAVALDLVLRHGGRRANEKALDLVSRARSPVLVEDLLQNRRRAPKDEATYAAIVRLRDELLSPGVEPEAEETRAVALRGELDRMTRWALRSQSRPPAIVQRALQARALERWRPRLRGRALVVFDRGPSGWRAFHSTADHVEVIPLPHLEHVLATEWTSLRLNLSTAARLPADRRGEFLERTREASLTRLEILRDAAWNPLPEHDGRTVVVPFGALHSVPFEAFVQDEGRVVSRLPHPALLRSPRRRSPERALLLHGPHEGPRHEADVLATQLRAAGLKVTVSGSRGALESAGSLDILHVAAHGTYHRDAWLLSGIELEDGWVGFEHLQSRRVRGALISVTSCESGLAEQMPGSDIEGWITAGLSAGAGGMVLTLWKIDDASALAYSGAFYGAWLAGSTPAEAAREARLATRRALPHPYHWAAFSVAE